MAYLCLRSAFQPCLELPGKMKHWTCQTALNAPFLSLQASRAKEHNVRNRYLSVCRSSQRLLWRIFNSLVGIILGLRLAIFALLLLIPFVRIGYTYFSDRRVHRNIRFGPQRRNFLDVYCPSEAMDAKDGQQSKVPVVVAVMGGAWVINHRAWNAQLGQRLMDAGIMMVAVDYRSYPFGGVRDMLDDLECGLAWVFDNVTEFGGDAANVMITGQSAGAHLSALLLLRKSLAELQAAKESSPRIQANDMDAENIEAGFAKHGFGWSVQDLRGFVGVSGPYDLHALGEQLESRWIGNHLLDLICSGNLEDNSPTLLLQSSEWRSLGLRAAAFLPPMCLFHGANDKTVPAASSLMFAEALRVAGAPNVRAEVRHGLAHAEVIIEGPMRGEDYQVQLLLPFLLGDEAEARLAAMPSLRPMFPRCIINFASLFMPF
eukprot:TRINITY_DN39782_c0_g1_i1.p1 TRINITY_DN39782_c0_g1~~TRINITY_DN39782_c0_g1_i1.p1  ORF type:complete len:431 (-),score=71.89 TRINITY_DN39782_c0_g1_i1:48-1340(-)